MRQKRVTRRTAPAKWVFVTGSANEIPEDDYEEVIDKAAAALLITYKDKDILKVRPTLFSGAAGGAITTTSYGCSSGPRRRGSEAYSAAAQVTGQCDADLACGLLNLDEKAWITEAGEELHSAFIRWLERTIRTCISPTRAFSIPANLRFPPVDMERKYLHKGLRTYEKEPLVPEDDDEAGCLEVFRQLGDGEQRALSEYSHSIHADGAGYWRRWLHLPPEEQLRAAAAGREVYL